MQETPWPSDFWKTPKNNKRAKPKIFRPISILGRQDAFAPSSLFQYESLKQTLVYFMAKAGANAARA
ncbi:hypothetical protein B4Q04_18495 [Zobellia sp. OII3]|nr:hypothetical protein B4Q04_18495 [Zobellia sp. OII3]